MAKESTALQRRWNAASLPPVCRSSRWFAARDRRVVGLCTRISCGSTEAAVELGAILRDAALRLLRMRGGVGDGRPKVEASPQTLPSW